MAVATTHGGTLIGLRVETPELLPRAKAPFARTGRLVIAAVAVAPIAVYLYVALHRIGYPYELEWLEGGAVEIVNRVAHGHGIYVAPSLHYVAYPYPPLYFWVSALLAKGIGVGFVAPRLVSFVASLGSLVVLWDVVRRDTGDALAGLVAAGIFAATYVVGGAYFDLARVDSLFVFLLLASIAVARRARSWRGGVAVGGLVFLSFFTKQTALLAAAPMFAYLLVARRRIAVSAIVTLAVLGIASTLVMNAVSHGWYDYFVFHELLNQGINAKAVRTFIPKSLIRPTGWAIGLALVGGLIGWRRARVPEGWMFWVAVWIGLVGASWVSLVHAGGSSDVLMPAYAAIALGAGIGTDIILRLETRYQGVVGAVLAVVLAVQVIQLSHRPLHEIPSAASEAAGHRFIALVASLPGQVIVADHPWYDTMAGKPSWAQSEAVHDVLRAGPSTARTDLLESIESSFTSPLVRSVFIDNHGDTIGPGFDRYFRLGPAVFTCDRCFFPVTDVPRRPYLHYVRR
jgi:Dolichyl-phosphate-mannose-protein mannosyltransferase